MMNTGKDTRLWQGIPGVEITPGGRIYVVWFSGGDVEPHPDNTIYMSVSDDGGQTFGDPQVVAAPKDGTRTYDPALWMDPTGKLWMIFNRGTKDAGNFGVFARTCANPDAPNPVWSDETRLGFDVPFSFRLNKLTVLSSGEWIMPVTISDTSPTDWFPFEDQQQAVAISHDNGQSWKLHGKVVTPQWALECMVVELKDGRLWMLVRTSVGVLYQSFSEDKGLIWAESTPSEIKNPGSRYFIRRLASGNLLLVNHYKFTNRSHMTALLSTDDGKTWKEGLLLDERSDVSYPDGVQTSDGKIWVVYDRERYGAKEILCASFTEEDITAGRCVSSGSFLKRIVNKI